MMTKQNITDLIESLKRERDELHLKFHLFKQEARDEWATLEKKWTEVQHKASTVGTAAGEVAGEIGATMRLVGQEVREGYRKIRESLK